MSKNIFMENLSWNLENFYIALVYGLMVIVWTKYDVKNYWLWYGEQILSKVQVLSPTTR